MYITYIVSSVWHQIGKSKTKQKRIRFQGRGNSNEIDDFSIHLSHKDNFSGSSRSCNPCVLFYRILVRPNKRKTCACLSNDNLKYN